MAGDEDSGGRDRSRLERKLTVEVDVMAYNPLGDEGDQRIEKGDVVSVGGTMDDDFIEDDFIEGRERVADPVIELVD